jgi:hypothetical protein
LFEQGTKKVQEQLKRFFSLFLVGWQHLDEKREKKVSRASNKYFLVFQNNGIFGNDHFKM